VSPTAPTFGTLNDRLAKAHRRIRELEARETELLAHNRTLRAVITEITHDDDPRTAAAVTSSSNDDSDGFGIGDHPGKHTHQRPR
jgi:ribosome biogenesis protein Nip4